MQRIALLPNPLLWPRQDNNFHLAERDLRLKRPYRSRNALARESVDFVAAQLPERQIRVLGDGGSATTEYLRGVPATVTVVSGMLITGKLYERKNRVKRKNRVRSLLCHYNLLTSVHG